MLVLTEFVCGLVSVSLICTHSMVFKDRVLYTPERLAKIAQEAAKDNSIFSLEDRMGLVYDAMALSRAGLAKLSSALTLVDLWKNEKECKPYWPHYSHLRKTFIDPLLLSRPRLARDRIQRWRSG